MTPAAPITPASITVQITPVIEREFKRRDIFPELRLENAARIQNGATGLHHVTIDRAKELLADAAAMQARNRELPRGIPAAYCALVRNLAAALRQEARRGVWDDPGIEEVKKRVAQSLARFETGDCALYFETNEGSGLEVTVVGDYGMYTVRSDTGAFIHAKEGYRFDYRSGYVVKGSGQSFLALPHQLTRDDCKPTHLCMVASREGVAA